MNDNVQILYRYPSGLAWVAEPGARVGFYAPLAEVVAAHAPAIAGLAAMFGDFRRVCEAEAAERARLRERAERERERALASLPEPSPPEPAAEPSRTA